MFYFRREHHHMKYNTKKELEKIILEYETVLKVVDHTAIMLDSEGERTYGGYIRATKGRLQEYITQRLIEIAWFTELGQDRERLDVNSVKIDIPINLPYTEIVPKYLKKYILDHLGEYSYGISVDKQVFVDNTMVIGIECKAYTENAMLKRILVDFMLLKTQCPKISCYLFQLESMLGGDYSGLKRRIYGSKISHTIMSYFPSVNLDIVTFIKGERRVDQPIHKSEFYKPLPLSSLERALNILTNDLKKYIR